MTDEIVALLSSGTFEEGKPLSNALLESFAIHVRNLIYFFYADSEERYKDDFRDFDLLPNKARWKEVRPPKSQVLIDAYERASKQVAHLSYAEIDKRWPFVEIWQELIPVIRAFFGQVPIEKLGNRWTNAIPSHIINEPPVGNGDNKNHNALKREGTSGKVVVSSANENLISHEDSAEIAKTIEDGCEQIDPDF